MATLNPNTKNTGAGLAKAPTNDDLQNGFQKVLSSSNFSFSGNFYHSSLLSNPPNPCLTIEGLGLIGLPLGERDAKAIIATCPTPKAVPLRRGRGRGKAKAARATKELRTTWEIEPSKVSFGNTAWQNYVDMTLCGMFCKSLGVKIGNAFPKMELNKLLVYETGAHLLPDEEETEKIDGVFGTAILVLPSAYTGGQVVVSYGSTTKTIDLAKDSMLSTAFLAWYSGVKYEVKPVESGYRVALAYKLVHPQESGVTLPCLPDMSTSTNELRLLVKKWQNEKGKENCPPYIAYLLKERHDPFVFKIQGLNALKGVDLHQLTVVRPVAEEEGFRVYIAFLEHKVSGFSEPTYQKRRRNRYESFYDDLGLWSDDDDNDNTRVISEINSVTTKITELRDMNGASLLVGTEIDVVSNCLVPNKPFEGVEPDKVENDRSVCSGLVHSYHRTALVLIPEDTADDILHKALGAPYAYRMLSKSTNIPPTSEDRKWAERLLNGGKSLNERYVITLLKFALDWKDIELWKSTANIPTCTVSAVNAKTLVNPVEVFPFEELRPSFEALLGQSGSLTDKIDFLSNILAKGSSNDSLNVWYQKELSKIASSYSSAKVEDIPTLLTIIRLIGLQNFWGLVMPNLEKHEGYGFWMGFVKAICNNWVAILEQQSSLGPAISNNVPTNKGPSSSPSTQMLLSNIIKQGLKFACTEWSAAELGPDYYLNIYSGEAPTLVRVVKFDRIIEVLEQAIVISDWEICKLILEDMLTSKWFTSSKRINDVFLPLLPRLRELLTRKNLTQFQSPFAEFIRSFVELYLREMLGKRTELSVAHMHKVGCRVCEHCKLLDDFIMNPRVKTTLIRAPKRERLHLERRADKGLDLYTYEVVKSTNPHGLQFTKLPAVIEASTWASRQKAAKVFLDTVGPWSDLSRIMGDRTMDVKHAFEGSRPYDTPSASTTAPTATTSMGAGVTTSQNSAQTQVPRVASTAQVGSIASSTSTAVPRKVSETGFPQQAASLKKRKT